MASITTLPNGFRRIQFVAGDGTRKAVRLGKVTLRAAEACKVKLEALAAAAALRGVPDDETARWLAGLDARMHARLVKVGLADRRDRDVAVTLRALLDAYFAHLDVKPITALSYQATRTAMLTYCGADTPARDVQPLRADQWRAQMKADGLAEATISKRVGIAKHVFRRAVAWKMVPENPFAGSGAGAKSARPASGSSAWRTPQRCSTPARMTSGG